MTDVWMSLSEPDQQALHPGVQATAVTLAVLATAVHRGITAWALARGRD